MPMATYDDEQEMLEVLDAMEHATSEEWFEAIEDAIREGEAELTMRVLKRGIADGVDPWEVAQGPLVDSMSAVGKDFKAGDFYIPDVLMSARALQAALFVLRDYAPDVTASHIGGQVDDGTNLVVLIGTVAGDLHDIGKNIASVMFELNGYQVIDLGIDVVPAVFVDAVRRYHPDVVGLSALLTTTIGEMRNTIVALEEAGLRKDVKVYVSGTPITQEFSDEIGADHFCADVRDSLDYLAHILQHHHGSQHSSMAVSGHPAGPHEPA